MASKKKNQAEENATDICYTISIPVDSTDTLFEYRITKLINAKAKLLKKVFNTDSLIFEIKDGKITFDWLPPDSQQEMIQASMKFFCKLVDLIKNVKRVNCKDKETPSEKYAFRCFLLLIEKEKVKLNETISRLENRKINIQKEIDLIKNYTGNTKTRTSQTNTIYQPVNEFSLLLWDLMLEKAIVYKDRIEFVWKK